MDYVRKILVISGTKIKMYFISLQLYSQVYFKCALDRSVVFALLFLKDRGTFDPNLTPEN